MEQAPKEQLSSPCTRVERDSGPEEDSDEASQNANFAPFEEVKKRTLESHRAVHMDLHDISHSNALGQVGVWEPISLPNWDMLQDDQQQQALDYLARTDPDLLVVAWPCGPWSPLQDFGYKTKAQRVKLAEKRQEQRRLLYFVKRKEGRRCLR